MVDSKLLSDTAKARGIFNNIVSVRSGLRVLKERMNNSLDIRNQYGPERLQLEQVVSMIYLLDETLERLRSIEQVSFAS